MATPRVNSRPIEPIRPLDCKLAEHAYRTHAVIVRRETGVVHDEDLLNPVLYEHIAKSIRAFDRVELIDEAGSYYAKVLVTFAQGSMVRVALLQFTRLEAATEDLDEPSSDYELKLKGPLRWCVIKRSTGETIKENLPDKAAALRELAEIRRAMAA